MRVMTSLALLLLEATMAQALLPFMMAHVLSMIRFLMTQPLPTIRKRPAKNSPFPSMVRFLMRWPWPSNMPR